MSVMITLRVKADGSKLEALAKRDAMTFPAVADKGKSMGALYHRFYASNDEILVVDEWDSEASFHAFFESTPEIQTFMTEAGVTEAPTITVWRKLETGDDIG